MKQPQAAYAGLLYHWRMIYDGALGHKPLHESCGLTEQEAKEIEKKTTDELYEMAQALPHYLRPNKALVEKARNIMHAKP